MIPFSRSFIRLSGTLLCGLAAALLLFTSCDPSGSSASVADDEAQLSAPAPDLSSPLTFAPSVSIASAEVQTRALDPLTNGPETFQTFGVTALWKRSDVTFATNRYYLDKVTANRPDLDAEDVLWRTTPSAYWPAVGTLDFFMYAPYRPELTSIKSLNPTTGLPTMRYTPEAVDIANQLDFCLAEPVYNATAVGYGVSGVPATFRHTLTNVEFYVNYVGNVPSGYNVYLEELTIENVIGSKSIAWTESEPYYQWQADAECTNDSSYSLLRSQTHLKDEVIPSKTSNAAGAPLQNSAGRLYLLPQTIQAGARLHVVYGFYYGTLPSATLVVPFDKYIALPAGTVWPADKTVRYHVTIDVGESSEIMLSCEILPFTDAQVRTGSEQGSSTNPVIYY